MSVRLQPITPVVQTLSSDTAVDIYTCPAGKRFDGYVYCCSTPSNRYHGNISIIPARDSYNSVTSPVQQGAALLVTNGDLSQPVPIHLRPGETVRVQRAFNASSAILFGTLEDNTELGVARLAGRTIPTSATLLYTVPAGYEMTGYLYVNMVFFNATHTLQVWVRTNPSGSQENVNRIVHTTINNPDNASKTGGRHQFRFPLHLDPGTRLWVQGSVAAEATTVLYGRLVPK